ncbi:MAG: hypothetical protein ABWK01_01410, partial [Infirmifilum sp.]
REGVDLGGLAGKLESMGLRVRRVLELGRAVSVEAPASRVVEAADLQEVASLERARVFRALGEGV